MIKSFLRSFAVSFVSTVALALVLTWVADFAIGAFKHDAGWLGVALTIFIISCLIQHAIWVWGSK